MKEVEERLLRLEENCKLELKGMVGYEYFNKEKIKYTNFALWGGWTGAGSTPVYLQPSSWLEILNWWNLSMSKELTRLFSVPFAVPLNLMNILNFHCPCSSSFSTTCTRSSVGVLERSLLFTVAEDEQKSNVLQKVYSTIQLSQLKKRYSEEKSLCKTDG